MKFFKQKKGQTQMWWIILAAVLAVTVSVLLIIWFKGAGDKGFGGVSDTIDSLEDSDKDGVADLFDDCLSNPNDDVGSNGCLPGQKGDT